MQKLLFASSLLVALLCSCGGKEDPNNPIWPSDETPDKVTITIQTKYSESTDKVTSFEYLNVKTVCKIDGNVTDEVAITAANGLPWNKTIELPYSSGKSIKFEMYSEFSLKDEANLPEKLNVFCIPNVHVVFSKGGKELKGMGSTRINYGQVSSLGLKTSIGLSKIKQHLSNFTKESYTEATIVR